MWISNRSTQFNVSAFVLFLNANDKFNFAGLEVVMECLLMRKCRKFIKKQK